MTSLKYSANRSSAKFDLKQAFATNLIPAICLFVYCIFNFIILVVNSFRNVADWGYTERNGNDIGDYIKNNAAVIMNGRSNSFLIGCIAAGIFFAIANVYVMKRKNVNFYFSLPVDRATLFKNRMLAAFGFIAGIYFITILIDFFINTYYLDNHVFLIKMALSLFAECVVYTSVSFVIFTIGMISCYTVVEGLFFGTGLLAFPTVLAAFASSLCESYVKGFARESVILQFTGLSANSNIFTNSSLLTETANFNPIFFGKKIGSGYLGDTISKLAVNWKGVSQYDTLQEYESGNKYVLPDMNYFIPLIIWAAFCVIGIFVARRIFVARKAENTELHASNNAATFIFALEFSLGITAILLQNGIFKESMAAALLIAPIFIISFYIVAAVNKRKIKFDLKTYVIPAVIGLCLSASCFAVHAGPGLPAPKLDEIEAASISSFVDIAHNEDRAVMNFEFPVVDYFSDKALGVFTDKEDLKKLIDVVEDISTNTKNTQEKNISVAYFLKNGKKVTRNYRITNEYAALNVLSLTDTKAYKEELKYLLIGDSKKESELHKISSKYGIFDDDSSEMDSSFISTKLIFDKCKSATLRYSYGDEIVRIDNTEELRKALYKDLEASDYMQRFCPTEKELFKISFCYYDIDAETGEEYYYSDPIYYRIYPSMKNTVQYLASVGALKEPRDFKYEPYKATIIKYKDIKYYGDNTQPINTQFYESFIDTDDLALISESLLMDYYGNRTVENKAQLEELINVSRSYKFANDDDMVVIYEMKDDKDNTVYQFMIIDREHIPEFAK